MDGIPGLAQPARRLRVAVVTETYLPEINGVAMTMGHLVRGLCARGHCIELIRPRQRPAEVAAQGPLLHEVLLRGVPIPRYDALKIGLPARTRLLRRWSTCRPDVVHLVTEGPLGWSGLSAALALDIPVVSDFHTNFHSYTSHYGIGWLKKPVTAYLRNFHNKTACTFVPTQDLRKELHSWDSKISKSWRVASIRGFSVNGSAARAFETVLKRFLNSSAPRARSPARRSMPA